MIPPKSGWVGLHDIFRATFPCASESTVIKNCGPYPFGSAEPTRAQLLQLRERNNPTPKRIRQSSKPLLNKLETEFYDTIKSRYPNYPPVRPQSVRLKIGCGAWYKGDFFVGSWPQEIGPAMPTIFECKGPKEGKNVARGILTIKVAAHQYPEIAFYLIWKDDGQWREQRILASPVKGCD